MPRKKLVREPGQLAITSFFATDEARARPSSKRPRASSPRLPSKRPATTERHPDPRPDDSDVVVIDDSDVEIVEDSDVEVVAADVAATSRVERVEVVEEDEVEVEVEVVEEEEDVVAESDVEVVGVVEEKDEEEEEEVNVVEEEDVEEEDIEEEDDTVDPATVENGLRAVRDGIDEYEGNLAGTSIARDWPEQASRDAAWQALRAKKAAAVFKNDMKGRNSSKKTLESIRRKYKKQEESFEASALEFMDFLEHHCELYSREHSPEEDALLEYVRETANFCRHDSYLKGATLFHLWLVEVLPPIVLARLVDLFTSTDSRELKPVERSTTYPTVYGFLDVPREIDGPMARAENSVRSRGCSAAVTEPGQLNAYIGSGTSTKGLTGGAGRMWNADGHLNQDGRLKVHASPSGTLFLKRSLHRDMLYGVPSLPPGAKKGDIVPRLVDSSTIDGIEPPRILGGAGQLQNSVTHGTANPNLSCQKFGEAAPKAALHFSTPAIKAGTTLLNYLQGGRKFKSKGEAVQGLTFPIKGVSIRVSLDHEGNPTTTVRYEGWEYRAPHNFNLESLKVRTTTPAKEACPFVYEAMCQLVKIGKLTADYVRRRASAASVASSLSLLTTLSSLPSTSLTSTSSRC
ncbi:hypothetical protein JCM10212_000493 [Sporobolomyces blumeae]